MKKSIALWAAIISLALALSGCVFRGQETRTVSQISLPESDDEPENMILGETMLGNLSEVSLYYAATDGSSFSTVRRSLRTEAGESVPEAAVRALLSSPGPTGVRTAGDVRVLSFE